MTSKARASGWRVLFDGQSLNIIPTSNPYPTQLMSGRGVSYTNIAVGGAPLTFLKVDVAMRMQGLAAKAATAVLVVLGAETDISLGASASGVYSSFVTHSTNAKAAGVDYMIGTTVPPQASPNALTGPQETVRQSLNTLILGDASHAFDAVVDVAADSRLSDASNTTYYVDGLHFTAAGAAVTASLVLPVLQSLGVVA